MPIITVSSLLARTAAGDRVAFAHLYDTESESAARPARRVLPCGDAVRAVVHATFVEVWWLSKFHAGADTDVPGWIGGIATRRADDRCRLPGDAAHRPDELNRLALEGLLGRRLAA